ncbi:hypothetical protein Clacol_009042 [Clathrus columnatus]|uniref:Protein kinase domain-containing protein n=1 Tax=Clathrus columnatus TaxID=1419009 RepID=A0AAV5AJG4_9AGAM|nr:hypothetical protein Clacol_009042 [Clathrus columnatus]
MAFPSIPSHIISILQGSKHSRRARESRDILWHHFQPFLASKGYQIAWDGDNLGRTDLRTATNPFSPKSHEAFAAATAGRNGVRWGGPRATVSLTVENSGSSQGLAFMHKQRVAHLDIYPLNILVNHVVNRPNQAFLQDFDFRLAFIDFEFSRRIRNSLQGYLIEPRYLPPTYDGLPEVKRGNRQIDPFAADVSDVGEPQCIRD